VASYNVLDDQGKPDFPQLCECVLLRRSSASLIFVAFDVLSIDGWNVMGLPHVGRREAVKPGGRGRPLARPRKPF
jgi:ATP-dependent DNA ligase